MADYYHLDVYKSSYKLLLEIYKNTRNLNREYKYTTGEKIKERAFAILIGIAKANRSKNKVIPLDKVLDDVEYLRLSLRLLRDLGVLSEKKFVNLIVLSEDVLSQVERWRKYEEGHTQLHSEPGSQASHRR